MFFSQRWYQSLIIALYHTEKVTLDSNKKCYSDLLEEWEDKLFTYFMPNTWWVYHILQTLRRIMYLFSLNSQHNIYASSSYINWLSPPPFISTTKLWPLWWQRPCLLLTAISKLQSNGVIWSVCRGETIQRMDELI